MGMDQTNYSRDSGKCSLGFDQSDGRRGCGVSDLPVYKHYADVPSDFVIDVAVALPVGALVVLLLRSQRTKSRSAIRRRVIFWIAIALTVLLELCLLIVWWSVRPPSVYRPFTAMYELHRNQLGKPQTEEKTDDLVYQGSYEVSQNLNTH